MRIACLLPKRNNKEFYEQAFKSLCLQKRSYSNILVCENYSTDGSKNLAHFLADSMPNASVVTPPRPAKTFGESIQFLIQERPPADFYHIASSDDIWSSKYLQFLGDALRLASCDVTAIFCDRVYVDSRNRVLGASGNASIPRVIPQEMALNRFLGGNAYNIAGALFRSDVISNAFDLAVSTGDAVDWALMIEASRLGSVMYICKPLYRYRLHPKNTAKTSGYTPAEAIEGYLKKSCLYADFIRIQGGKAMAAKKKALQAQTLTHRLMPYLKYGCHALGVFTAIRHFKGLDGS